MAAKPYLETDEMFLANYTDDLTDCPSRPLIEHPRGERRRRRSSLDPSGRITASTS